MIEIERSGASENEQSKMKARQCLERWKVHFQMICIRFMIQRLTPDQKEEIKEKFQEDAQNIFEE